MKMTIEHAWDNAKQKASDMRSHAKTAWDLSTDGCTSAPDFNFVECCRSHDFKYRNGTTSRFVADWILAECIWAKGHQGLAMLYFVVVRAMGWLSYDYTARKRYVSSVDINRWQSINLTGWLMGIVWVSVLVLLMLIVGCASDPTPFETGDKAPTPVGCIELRKRGGDC